MQIAVLSGKGGAGKTFVSVNLAAAFSNNAIYVDADVEEPNGHLFFRPETLKSEEVSLLIPAIDPNLCNGCQACTRFCRYNALVLINGKIEVFPELCHACGGCCIVCPQKAISEIPYMIGKILVGKSMNTKVISGFLNPGEQSGVPIIKQMLESVRYEDDLTIIDCPPGNGCSVMESIRDTDYCLLVVEPTLFGLHNFKMVLELVKVFNKPFGILINKFVDPVNLIDEYCKTNNLPILTRIPFEFRLAKSNSKGEIISRTNPKDRLLFQTILKQIVGDNHETTIDT